MAPENQALPDQDGANSSGRLDRKAERAGKGEDHRARRVVIGLLVAGALVVTGAVISWRLAVQNSNAQDPDQQHAKENNPTPTHLFPGWTRPDLAIIVSGQMKGYLQPCGCSDPQYGGLARRYNFIKSLESKGWPVVCVDLGDLAQTTGPPHEQLLLKYTTAMRTLKLMKYTGIGVGKSEFAFPLSDALAHYALNDGEPAVLGANLLSREKKKYGEALRAWAVAEKSSPRVGVVGLVSKSLREQLAAEKNEETFSKDVLDVLREALKDLGQQHVELGVLFVQGKERDARDAQLGKEDAALREAKTCAEEAARMRQTNPALAPINIILWTAGADRAEPPSMAIRVGETMLITLGHKGKNVGVVGVYRNPKGQGLTLRYQLVPIGPEYDTPQGMEADNPVIAVMEEYALQVKKNDFMAKFPRSMHSVQVDFPKARYVGSAICGDCHPHAGQIWENSAHSHAYNTLVKDAKHPSNRQFDGECVVCHTVGFEHKTGFYDLKNHGADARSAAKLNEALHHVGCESCHGPGSEHIRLEHEFAANANNPVLKKQRSQMHRLINHYKASEEELDPKTSPERRKEKLDWRMLQIDIHLCQKCHDQENDVHWNFSKKWPKVIHMTPP
jgi:cytochrome c554/c'-like protein